MLGFFPTPYPDEILYSVFARYHVRSGNTSPKWTLQELFGSRSTSAIIDLPCNIDNLINRMPLESKFTQEQLIYDHTLFPFYSPFLLSDRASLVFDSMKGNKGGDIHSRTGIMASSITTPAYLRFCPVCFQEDIELFGEPYWHRIHQVPGVLVCTTHNEVLHNSNVSALGLNKHLFITAGEENCISKPRIVKFSGDTMEKLLFLANDVVWLLNQKLLTNKAGYYREKYLNLLIEKNYATPNGRVDQKELLDDFVSFYGSDFLTSVQSMVRYDKYSWLASIVRKHRKTFHPIRHLLMMRFLAGSPANFFENCTSYKPFGYPPWPCLNAAADHYLKPVVNDITITHCCDTKRPVGTFSCSCGFVFSRRGPDTNKDDIFRIGRIKSFGPTWEKRLKELVESNKLTVRQIARTLKVDDKTVKRYADKLSLNAPWIRNTPSLELPDQEKQNERLQQNKEKHRVIWKNLQDKQPELSKTSLRRLLPATYAWLYRNDRNWLDLNSPAFTGNCYVNKRVDWEERDLQLLEKVKKVIKEMLLQDGKPERITISRIGRRIGQLALLEKHIVKMPLTEKYLEQVTENVEDYQVRRVKWAAVQIRNNGEEITEWKIKRLAGLRTPCSYKVILAINEEMMKDQYIGRDNSNYFKGAFQLWNTEL